MTQDPIHQELRRALDSLDDRLQQHPFARRRLRAPAAETDINSTCERLGVQPAPTIRTLYGWRDGSGRRSGEWQLFLFPPFWEFLRLERVVDEAPWPTRWCREVGVEGVPFALEATGQFLVAQSGTDDRVLRVSSDHVVPAWPDGTMLGLVTATRRALDGEDPEYSASFTDDKMSWLDEGVAT